MHPLHHTAGMGFGQVGIALHHGQRTAPLAGMKKALPLFVAQKPDSPAWLSGLRDLPYRVILAPLPFPHSHSEGMGQERTLQEQAEVEAFATFLLVCQHLQ